MCLPWKKNDVAVYYLLPWHLLFTMAIYYLGHILFVGSILLWSTIDINRYTEILDACSQKLRGLIRKKIVEKGPENFERQPVSKVPLGLPGFHLWAVQIEIALPSSVDMAQLWISTSQELCFVFFFLWHTASRAGLWLDSLYTKQVSPNECWLTIQLLF